MIVVDSVVGPCAVRMWHSYWNFGEYVGSILTHPIHFSLENGGKMYLLNFGNTPNIHTVLNTHFHYSFRP
jgi:hypothetical protein